MLSLKLLRGRRKATQRRFILRHTPSPASQSSGWYYRRRVEAHSEDYRIRYADNLSKELPRIPCLKAAGDFWSFSRAGRSLADLHLAYEAADPYPVTIKQGDLRTAEILGPKAFYRVSKMKFGGKRGETEKCTVIYNDYITLQNVPLEAYAYVINGRSAIEWVMERQCANTDKASGIVNDANDYANETMNDPEYPLQLLLSVITVSMKTLEIVRSLPELDILEEKMLRVQKATLAH